MKSKLIFIPYVLILIWIIFSVYTTLSNGLVGVIIGPVFIAYGIAALIGYTIILGIVFIVKKLFRK